MEKGDFQLTMLIKRNNKNNEIVYDTCRVYLWVWIVIEMFFVLSYLIYGK